MKYLFVFLFSTFSLSLFSQRPATKAETEEDARVLKTLSDAMPHNLYESAESERSNGVSNLNGLTGWDNDMNFVTRDVYDHQYTIVYEFTKKFPPGLEQKIETARQKNDFAYQYGATVCEIEILVNATFNPDVFPYAFTPIKKLNSPYCDNVYRDEAGSTFTFLFFGNNWTINPNSSLDTDSQGKEEKRYSLDVKFKTHPGTDIQGIMVYIKGHKDLTDIVMKNINWQKIASLLGTGKINDDFSTSELKKYFVEQAVQPVNGPNTLSFTYVDEAGAEKQYVINSSKHDLPNCAVLRNHNENPKILESAHIDLSLQDDKDPNRAFNLSLPIIRTTGSVVATYDTDYNYEIMWRGNTDADHSFTASNITINLTKWAPEGDFIEGTFSGDATLKDHNNFSTDVPKYKIKNGKFRIRRIKDQMK